MVLEYSEILNDLVKNEFLLAGFEINNEKGDFFPKAKGKWLVTMIDTAKLTHSVPNEKTHKPLENNILRRNYVTPKILAKIAGRFSSMHFGFGIFSTTFC